MKVWEYPELYEACFISLKYIWFFLFLLMFENFILCVFNHIHLLLQVLSDLFPHSNPVWSAHRFLKCEHSVALSTHTQGHTFKENQLFFSDNYLPGTSCSLVVMGWDLVSSAPSMLGLCLTWVCTDLIHDATSSVSFLWAELGCP